MGSGGGRSGGGLEDRCLVCLVCLVYLVNQMNQTNRHSFRTLLERCLAEFLEKILNEGLTLLFEYPAGHGDSVVQFRLCWKVEHRSAGAGFRIPCPKDDSGHP